MTLTCKVTLDSYSVDSYIFDIRDPKTCKTRKDHRSNVTRTRNNKGHAQGHVTLTYRVTLGGFSVDSCSFEFNEQNYIKNSSQIISLAYPRPNIGTVM